MKKFLVFLLTGLGFYALKHWLKSLFTEIEGKRSQSQGKEEEMNQQNISNAELANRMEHGVYSEEEMIQFADRYGISDEGSSRQRIHRLIQRLRSAEYRDKPARLEAKDDSGEEPVEETSTEDSENEEVTDEGPPETQEEKTTPESPQSVDLNALRAAYREREDSQFVDQDTLLAALRAEREANNDSFARSEALDSFICESRGWMKNFNHREKRQDERISSTEDAIKASDEWIEKRFPEHIDTIMKDVERRDNAVLEVANQALRLAQQATAEVFTKNLFRPAIIGSLVLGVVLLVVGFVLFIVNPQINYGREFYLWFPPLAGLVIGFALTLAWTIFNAGQIAREEEPDKDSEKEDNSEGK